MAWHPEGSVEAKAHMARLRGLELRKHMCKGVPRKSRKAVQDLHGRQARSFGWAPDWGSPHTCEARREALGA